jgi:hypothetical protein
MLEYVLQRYPKDYTKKISSNYRSTTQQACSTGHKVLNSVYADCILKYLENCCKIYFSVDNSWNFKAIPKSNISKKIYKGENTSSKNSN